MTTEDRLPDDDFLDRQPAVEDMTGLNRPGMYKQMAEGRFPLPVKISPRCVGWVRGEVRAWCRSRPRAAIKVEEGDGS